MVRHVSPGKRMRWVVIEMIGLSPEWDRWFDEAFTDLIASDEGLVQAEFDALIGASWRTTPPAPSPPASSAPPDEPS